MRTVRIALDEKCVSEDKIQRDMLGGAERMCMLWQRYLLKAGYAVSRWPYPPEGEYDLCIHSNVVDGRVRAKKHLMWTGTDQPGLVADLAWKGMDAVIMLTEFMRDKMHVTIPTFIVPAPFDHELLKYKVDTFMPHRIVCNSNASRYLRHLVEVANILTTRRVEFEWLFCGGSQLYSPMYPEEYDFSKQWHPNVHYQGILTREQMLTMLQSGHVHCYPAFSDIWETQGVAFLEAAALGLPVILPRQRPFVDVLPDAWFADTAEDTADMIEDLFKEETRVKYKNLTRYDSDVVFEKLITIVNDLVGGPK